jgi:allantoinase
VSERHLGRSPVNVTSPDGLLPAGPGYDHGWFAWNPSPSRPSLTLPGDARLAMSVVLDLGAVEWERTTPVVPPSGGRGIAPYPDFPRMSHREFGHRVGVFRLLRMMQQLGIPMAGAIDVLTVEHYGRLVEHLVPVIDEFLAAGLSASRPISGAMSEDEERHYIGESLHRLRDGLPGDITGWLGAARGESSRTPALLAEAGVQYVADWGNDDQPYPMTGAGALWSFPLSWELSDLAAEFDRQVLPWTFAGSIADAAEILVEQGASGGRVLALHLHPWLSGQAFRASAIEEVLRQLRGDERIWWATPREIVTWFARASAPASLDDNVGRGAR